ncbi:MAG TPA: hypothetical protein VGH49_08465 [Xanthobacteraceae bacterium]
MRPCVLHVDDDGEVLRIVSQSFAGQADVVSAGSIAEQRHPSRRRRLSVT